MISNSKKIIPILLIIIMLLASCGVNSPQEDLGEIAPKEYKYNEAYYLRTTFEDQTFETLSDFQMDNGLWYHLATIPQKMTDVERNAASMYSDKFAPHTVIQRYMTNSEHNKVTENRAIYTDSFTVTSIIIPINSDKAPFGYVFTRIEDVPSEIDLLIEKALYDFNGAIDSPTGKNSLVEMPQTEKDKFDKYLKGFEVFNNE